MKMYVIEGGEYEQRYIIGVAPSVEEAVGVVKAIFGPPYKVVWESPEPDGICGEFASVPRFSIQHTGCFSFTEVEVEGEEQWAIRFDNGVFPRKDEKDARAACAKYGGVLVRRQVGAWTDAPNQPEPQVRATVGEAAR